MAANSTIMFKHTFHLSKNFFGTKANQPTSRSPSDYSKTFIVKSHSDDKLKETPRIDRRQLISLSASSALSSACSCCFPNTAKAEDWSYGFMSGPPSWGSICSTGIKQSPIELPKTIEGLPKAESGKLEFQYLPVNPSFLNTGHGTMQVDFPQGTNRIIIGDRTLELLQYHFHAPSEHSINGERAAMEAHLVHRDAFGRLAVVGVLLVPESRAVRNACLQAALEFAPKEKTKKIPAPVSCFFNIDPEQPVCPSLQINPSFLLPRPDNDGVFRYMNYEGSLTTPPCSEGVDWYMLTNPIKIPAQQVIEFMQYVGDGYTYSMNSRPIQSLNGRTIKFGPF